MTMDSPHTWKLTIGGTDRAALIRAGTLEWTTKEGREIDTLRATLDDRAAVFGTSLTAYQEVVLTADPDTVNETIVFGGYITMATPTPYETGQWLVWEIQASGYEVLFDATPRVTQTWVNATAGTIATNLLTAAGLNTEFDVATYVEPGPTLEVFTADGEERLTRTLDRLAEQAEMMWYVSPEKDFHLAEESSASEVSPFDVIAPGTLADHDAGLYEIKAGSLSVKEDASSLVNRLTIVGGYALGDQVTDTFAGSDAETTTIGYAFKLSHQKIRSNVEVFYNGDSQVLGTAFVDYFGKVLANGQTVEVLVSRINGVVYFPLTIVFDPADVITVTYQPEEQQRLTLDASNSASSAASLALYGRYFDGVLDVSPITDEAEMLRVGEAYLEQYAFVIKTGTFETLRLGLRAGQSCGITSARSGLSGRYVLRTVANELLESGWVRSTVSFGERAEKLSDWVGGENQGNEWMLSGWGQQGPIQGDAGPIRLIDALTALLPGTLWDPSTGGDATGLVIMSPTPTAAGRLLGYEDGVLQAYMDSDGTIKWAGGSGILSSGGANINTVQDSFLPETDELSEILEEFDAVSLDNVLSFTLSNSAAERVALYTGGESIYLSGFEPGWVQHAILRSSALASAHGGNAWTRIEAVAASACNPRIIFRLRDGDGNENIFHARLGVIEFDDMLLSNIANAAADTDALNRQTADGRYAPIAAADHGGLTGLGDDDHTQYAKLLGRAGGQTIYGGTGANDDITLEPTSHATKTSAYVLLAPSGGNVGVGVAAAAYKLDVATATESDRGINVAVTSATGTNYGIVVGVSGAATINYGHYLNVTGAANNFGLIIVNPPAGAANYAIYVSATAQNYLAGNTGIGTAAPDRLLHAEVADAVTNAVTYGQRISHITSGTAAAGFGTGLELELENAAGTNVVAAAVEAVYTDATNASEDADLKLKTVVAGSLTENLRVGSNTQAGTPGTNYTQFDNTGHQTMVGTAKPWEDLRVEPVARTTGSNAPTFEQWADDSGLGDTGTSRGIYLYSFDDANAGQEKEVHFSMQMPHAWDGGPVEIHVHWIGAVADTTSAPRWGLEYAWKDVGEVFGATATIIYTDGKNYTFSGNDADITAGKHYISKFAELTPGSTADNISSILVGRLFRDSANGADTYNAAGAKCGLLYIDAHYQLNSLGSTDEYTK